MSVESKKTLQGSFLGIILLGAILMMIAYFGHGHDMGIPSPESRASAIRPLIKPAMIYHIHSPTWTTNDGQVAISGWRLVSGIGTGDGTLYFAPLSTMTYFTNHAPDFNLELIEMWDGQIMPLHVIQSRMNMAVPQVRFDRPQHVQ